MGNAIEAMINDVFEPDLEDDGWTIMHSLVPIRWCKTQILRILTQQKDIALENENKNIWKTQNKWSSILAIHAL